LARTKDPSAATRKAWLTRKRSGDDWRARLMGPVSKIEPLGGGVSQTRKVTLEDGTVGCFKWGGGLPEAEVAAWEVAKQVGMEDMVPPAVIREMDMAPPHGRQRGSFAEWMDGTTAERISEPGAQWGNDEHDVMRAAMFDFVIGNCDRHEGNWVVDDGKIRLIDHNLALSNYPFSEFFREIARTRMADTSLATYVKPYLDKLPHILAAVSGAMAQQRVPAYEKVVSDMEARIHRAASAATWGALLEELGFSEKKSSSTGSGGWGSPSWSGSAAGASGPPPNARS